MNVVLSAHHHTDLFLVCDEDNGRDHYYQIWTNNKDDGFELAMTGRFPAGFQSVSFADIGECARARPPVLHAKKSRPRWNDRHAICNMRLRLEVDRYWYGLRDQYRLQQTASSLLAREFQFTEW